jgi:1-acyl-sn-glycerol-3-phosphate acyltransferase
MREKAPFAVAPLLRGVVKMITLLVLVLAIIPCQCVVLPFGELAWRSARFWHRMLCRVLRLRVECVGRPLAGAQVVYAGNHLSYLDVPVIGGIVLGRFIAKADVRHWPLFGLLAQLQRTVFISRRSGEAVTAVQAMDRALRDGHNLILFPEGTSSAGQSVLAFKSSAFSAPAAYLEHGLCIQPFSINLARVDGHKSPTLSQRNLYAYYGEMELAWHLWRFLQTRGACVQLVFHPVLTAADGTQRKSIAAAATRVVASGLHGAGSPVLRETATRGRLERTP